ncbi:cupin [Liquorilactobacillus mali]|uniref:cupin n=1 Tax=Liquorilactobacillus mali TaxID=1618 RepID=UPI0039ED0172
MKKYQGTNKISNIFESKNQVITNLVIPKGKEIPAHHVPYTVVVVPVKGKIIFSGENFEEEIKPGIIVRMQPDEKHKLFALTDSEIMVIKSHLAN